jgi:hypothetical protein
MCIGFCSPTSTLRPGGAARIVEPVSLNRSRGFRQASLEPACRAWASLFH